MGVGVGVVVVVAGRRPKSDGRSYILSASLELHRLPSTSGTVVYIYEALVYFPPLTAVRLVGRQLVPHHTALNSHSTLCLRTATFITISPLVLIHV